MFKKIFIVIIIVFTFLITTEAVIADSSLNIKDFPSYLSGNDLIELQYLLDNVKEKSSLDIVIVITEDTQGKSSKDFADDYYDNNGYGIGSDYSGLLLLMNMYERELWISTTGRAIDIFTDKRLADIYDSIATMLSKSEYFEACKIFLSKVETYVVMGVPTGQYRESFEPALSYGQKILRIMQSVSMYVTLLIITLLITIVASISQNNVASVNRQTYEKEDSFKLNRSTDQFVREAVSKVRISSGGTGGTGGPSTSGRSSVHTGSSGRTHGGGGRKF